MALMPKVLVVDDEPAARAAMADAFEQAGFEVETATNGRVGINVFRRSAPALVVTDIVMPEQDGIATILALRRFAWPPKIIAVSDGGCGGRGAYLRWASKLGADDVLAKPFDMAILVEMARRLLAGENETALPLSPQLEFDFGLCSTRPHRSSTK